MPVPLSRCPPTTCDSARRRPSSRASFLHVPESRDDECKRKRLEKSRAPSATTLQGGRLVAAPATGRRSDPPTRLALSPLRPPSRPPSPRLASSQPSPNAQPALALVARPARGALAQHPRPPVVLRPQDRPGRLPDRPRARHDDAGAQGAAVQPAPNARTDTKLASSNGLIDLHPLLEDDLVGWASGASLLVPFSLWNSDRRDWRSLPDEDEGPCVEQATRPAVRTLTLAIELPSEHLPVMRQTLNRSRGVTVYDVVSAARAMLAGTLPAGFCLDCGYAHDEYLPPQRFDIEVFGKRRAWRSSPRPRSRTARSTFTLPSTTQTSSSRQHGPSGPSSSLRERPDGKLAPPARPPQQPFRLCASLRAALSAAPTAATPSPSLQP